MATYYKVVHAIT